MIIQLNPPIPVTTTSKGPGLAWLVIDYGCEHHLMWTVAINETGEIWTLPNPEVRAEKNITMGRISVMSGNEDMMGEIDKNLADTIEDLAILERRVEDVERNFGSDTSLINHTGEGIEKLFERIEKIESGIIDLYIKMAKVKCE